MPSAMNARRGWASGSKRASTGPLRTTRSFRSGMPSAMCRSWRAWFTERTRSATAVDTRSTAVRAPIVSGFDAPGQRERKNSGVASCRSRSSGTPARRRGSAAKTRKSGGAWTWTSA